MKNINYNDKYYSLDRPRGRLQNSCWHGADTQFSATADPTLKESYKWIGLGLAGSKRQSQAGLHSNLAYMSPLQYEQGWPRGSTEDNESVYPVRGVTIGSDYRSRL